VAPLEKHRILLYGRIGLSLALFIVSMVLAASAAITATSQSHGLLVGAFLIGAIVILPRKAVPSKEEARQSASDQERELFERMRRWLTWTRMAYLGIVAFVFLGLPELL
jgi:ABC-type transport system involved in cytochrome bd biosynthesis fused ATPase/permease subunit